MKIDICAGLSMPFFPMRPTIGRTLRTPKLVREFLAEYDPDFWEMQPKLNGDRACLATVRDRVYVQNRHGSWYRFKVKNADEFLKLGNGYCLDGEVFEGNFYPFEALAEAGDLCMDAPTHQRIALARALVESIKQPWLFETPSQDWLSARQRNAPKWEGIVLKRKQAGYTRHADDTATSLMWFKRRWDNRRSV